ncbi:hypothetical protein RGQ13_08730 [Thalassotalea psychrophila]|uniref:Uncharacterized protein n=1 Tax=Thalassotalea psychrophila TaxID=3065647 RepID=A0ABY9TZR1_9GAMM|nr:hypothetical protein RGQ13_08730 [Colwelliaceae bacterium SQ149]
MDMEQLIRERLERYDHLRGKLESKGAKRHDHSKIYQDQWVSEAQRTERFKQAQAEREASVGKIADERKAREQEYFDHIEANAKAQVARERQHAIEDKKADEERDKNKAIARKWLEEKNHIHLLWRQKKQDVGSSNLKVWLMQNEEPLRPTVFWFDKSTWKIKPEYAKHFKS